MSVVAEVQEVIELSRGKPYYRETGEVSVDSSVNGEKLVAWTTPHMRAERALQASSEALLTRRDKETAIAKARECLGHMRDYLAILEATPRL